jgi:hypothetical protein
LDVSAPPRPTCVVHIDKDGIYTFAVCGDARMLVIDEQASAEYDRVLQVATHIDETRLHSLIDGDPIGHSKDARHEAITARVLAGLEGRKHLVVVGLGDDKQ